MAAANGVAGDHGDHRLRRPADLHLEIEHIETSDALVRDVIVTDVAVVAADALVAAGAEGLVSLAREDDDADLVVVTSPVERVGELEERLRAEGVAHFGAVDGDLRDALGDVVLDVVVVGSL